MALGIVLRAILDPFLGRTVPFLTIFPAIVFASWYGGLGPGLMVTGVGALATEFFFIDPVNSLHIRTAGDGIALVLFIGLGVFVSLLSDQNRKLLASTQGALEKSEQARAELEKESKERIEAQKREQDTRRWSLDTLASIGDAVICTNVDSRITYLNGVAEQLTGWSHTAALDKPLDEIFVIVNETTRKPAPNPIRRVLQEGLVLGLANHTVLIARDGSEIPIDDSGAPIRNAERQIVGAVLVFRDISERKLMEDKLRETARTLERSNEDLASYAYAISHDLREPLRAIRAFSQLLEKRYKQVLDATADQYIQFVVDGAARMEQMITDLLKFSHAVNSSSGSMGQVRLADAVNWAERNLEGPVRETNAVIHCEDLPIVTADYVQVVQLFQNLIGNAIKYRSEEEPQIHIAARTDDTHWIVEVSDNGMGIAPENQQRIFGLFKRVKSDRPGSGIGLAVCKRIVERHGGEIWVVSEPGKGSTFYFTLAKRVPPPLPPGPPERARHEGDQPQSSEIG